MHQPERRTNSDRRRRVEELIAQVRAAEQAVVARAWMRSIRATGSPPRKGARDKPRPRRGRLVPRTPSAIAVGVRRARPPSGHARATRRRASQRQNARGRSSCGSIDEPRVRAEIAQSDRDDRLRRHRTRGAGRDQREAARGGEDLRRRALARGELWAAGAENRDGTRDEEACTVARQRPAQASYWRDTVEPLTVP